MEKLKFATKYVTRVTNLHVSNQKTIRLELHAILTQIMVGSNILEVILGNVTQVMDYLDSNHMTQFMTQIKVVKSNFYYLD